MEVYSFGRLEGHGDECSNPGMLDMVADELIYGYLAHSVLLPVLSGSVRVNDGA
jgi:hypothetical protein